MEDFFDILIPLVIAAVYFFGNILSKKSGDDLEEGLPMPRKREREVDPEQAERQRQVREEIRRKIEERRREAPATPASPGFPNPPPVVTAPPEPARSVRERTKRTNERVHETRAPVPVPESAEVEPDFSWDASDDIYENTMQAQLAQIEATRKKAAALKAQGAAATQKLGRQGRRSPKAGRGLLKGPVRVALRTPDAARTAFIYGEVLGKPVGMRPHACGAHKVAE